MTERELQVVQTVNELIELHVYRLPVDPFRIAAAHGARFATLSRWEQESGRGADYVFSLWGNTDGVTVATDSFWSINYNERKPENRIRFTVAEEMMHYLLGHADDHRFNIAAQDYDDATYELYEREARRAAGMLLVQPSTWYRYRSRFGCGQIARLCRVSAACVHTVARYYEENEQELRPLVTNKHIERDTAGLIPLRSLRPISVWPQTGML